MTATKAAGSAERWGRVWGARARDWAAIEEQQLPTYQEVIRRLGIGAGQRVLDIGCGSGAFLRAAAERGAQVAGVDASEALLAIARTRVPAADLRLADMEQLPFEDGVFDVVTGFNSFFFAADMTAAIREAGRVARPGAPVVLQVWGRPERSELGPVAHSVAPFLPPPDPDAPRGSELWQPGVLERFATAAGLTPAETFQSSWAYEFPDGDSLTRGILSAGAAGIAAERAGEDVVRRAILDAAAPYRMDDGGYRIANEWHYLVARAPLR